MACLLLQPRDGGGRDGLGKLFCDKTVFPVYLSGFFPKIFLNYLILPTMDLGVFPF